MRRSTAGFDFFENSVSGDIARCIVLAEIRAAVAIDEFFQFSIEQLPAKLVSKRIPHNRIHADEARRKMADGKELHELHIDEFRAGPESQRIGFAAHVC